MVKFVFLIVEVIVVRGRNGNGDDFIFFYCSGRGDWGAVGEMARGKAEFFFFY